MKRKKLDKYTWRRRGHRKRRHGESVQKDKYTPGADALIHGNNLRSVRPFARNVQLDTLKPERYAVPSIERRAVELRHREVFIKEYIETAFHHRVEDWHTYWIIGHKDSLLSIRVMFTRNKAILVKYESGSLTHSSLTYSTWKTAKKYAEVYHRYGTLVRWVPIDTPLLMQEPEEIPEQESFAQATIPSKTRRKLYSPEVMLAISNLKKPKEPD